MTLYLLILLALVGPSAVPVVWYFIAEYRSKRDAVRRWDAICAALREDPIREAYERARG